MCKKQMGISPGVVVSGHTVLTCKTESGKVRPVTQREREKNNKLKKN